MPVNTTTPVHRVARPLREGARLMAVQHGLTAIDVTPGVIAALAEESGKPELLGHERNLLKTSGQGGGVPTLVQFP